MFKDVNIKQILRVMLVVLFAAFMLTACEQDDSIGGRSRAAMAAPVGEDPISEETMKNASNAHRECWQTGMIDLLYQNMGKIAMGMYAKITDGALPLMMIAFALWTIFRLLKFVGSFTEDSPAEIWNEIVRKLFVCLICGLIASSTTQILWLLNTVVFPIYYAFLELGAAILNSAGDGSNFKAGSTVLSFFQEKLTLNEPVMCSAPAIGKASIESLSFPDGPRTMMNCMICTVNERLTLGFSFPLRLWMLPDLCL